MITAATKQVGAPAEVFSVRRRAADEQYCICRVHGPIGYAQICALLGHFVVHEIGVPAVCSEALNVFHAHDCLGICVILVAQLSEHFIVMGCGIHVACT